MALLALAPSATEAPDIMPEGNQAQLLVATMAPSHLVMTFLKALFLSPDIARMSA